MYCCHCGRPADPECDEHGIPDHYVELSDAEHIIAEQKAGFHD